MLHEAYKEKSFQFPYVYCCLLRQSKVLSVKLIQRGEVINTNNQNDGTCIPKQPTN